MKKKLIIIIIITLTILIAGTIVYSLNYEPEYEIPKLWLEGDMTNMLKKSDERLVKVYYTNGRKKFKSYANIKVQGTSSLAYDKKNYTINLCKDKNCAKEKNIDVGWGKESKYNLKANWIDKTHARNVVTAKIAAEIQEKYNLLDTAPNNGLIDGFPIEVYINEEFLGIYTWNIPKDAWMFNMDEENKEHIVFVSEGWDKTNLFKEEATYESWDIEVGRKDTSDLEKLNRLINFINNSSNEEFKKDFNKYLNFDATINYLIVAEYALLTDNIAKNMLLATYDGKVWYPTLYDLDTSWGTSSDGKELLDYSTSDVVSISKLWKRMVELYPNEIAERYYELKDEILNKEHILNKFNEFRSLIPEETFQKEFDKWSYIYIPGYNYDQIANFLDTRIPVIEKIMEERKEK